MWFIRRRSSSSSTFAGEHCHCKGRLVIIDRNWTELDLIRKFMHVLIRTSFSKLHPFNKCLIYERCTDLPGSTNLRLLKERTIIYRWKLYRQSFILPEDRHRRIAFGFGDSLCERWIRRATRFAWFDFHPELPSASRSAKGKKPAHLLQIDWIFLSLQLTFSISDLNDRLAELRDIIKDKKNEYEKWVFSSDNFEEGWKISGKQWTSKQKWSGRTATRQRKNWICCSSNFFTILHF